MKRDTPSYRGYRFPPEIISHAVWLYHRFCLSFRDVEGVLSKNTNELKTGAPGRFDRVPSIYSSASPWVGSRPCGAKYSGFCADSKGV